MKGINPEFKIKDLEFLAGKKKLLKSGELYDLLRKNNISDFDPLTEAFKML